MSGKLPKRRARQIAEDAKVAEELERQQCNANGGSAKRSRDECDGAAAGAAKVCRRAGLPVGTSVFVNKGPLKTKGKIINILPKGLVEVEFDHGERAQVNEFLCMPMAQRVDKHQEQKEMALEKILFEEGPMWLIPNLNFAPGTTVRDTENNSGVVSSVKMIKTDSGKLKCVIMVKFSPRDKAKNYKPHELEVVAAASKAAAADPEPQSQRGEGPSRMSAMCRQPSPVAAGSARGSPLRPGDESPPQVQVLEEKCTAPQVFYVEDT
jgi:hypothetical protein